MTGFKQEIIKRTKRTKGFSREQNVKLAIYSAELALPVFEKEYPNDNRPRNAIESAKKCIESYTKENRGAAADAAAAAYAAAYAAVDAAADAAAYAAVDAAYAAAYAAYAAAYASAYAAADAAARAKTEQKIMEYAVFLSN